MSDLALTTGTRIGRSLLASFILAIGVGIIWFVVQFSVAANIKDRVLSESIGYATIISAPAAGLLAGISGLIVGAVSRKGRLRRAIAWTAGIFFILSFAWILLLIVF